MYKAVHFSYKAVFSRYLLLLLLLLVAPSHLTLAPSGELREIGQIIRLTGSGPQAVSDGQTILAILCSHSRKSTAADRLLRHVYTGTFNLVGWYT